MSLILNSATASCEVKFTGTANKVVDASNLVEKSTSNPVNNGDINIQIVSNTQLKITLKGSDGVVRYNTLTLA